MIAFIRRTRPGRFLVAPLLGAMTAFLISGLLVALS
jgi:hypothetical protein